jgi:hypothetical protein
LSNSHTPREEPRDGVPAHEGGFDDQGNIRPPSPGFSIELLLIERRETDGRWTVSGALLREPGGLVRWVPGWIYSPYQERRLDSLWAYLTEKEGGGSYADVAFFRISSAAHAPAIADHYRKLYQQGWTRSGSFVPPGPEGMGLPLDVPQVETLAKAWDRTGVGAELWDDTVALGTRLLQAQEDDIHQKLRAWHHLLMAVGNFKRQGGTRIVTSLLPMGQVHDKPPVFTDRVLAVKPFGEPFELVRDDSVTWARLCDIPGVRVATASTVLSAIWPGFHAIMDRYAFAAALGLAAATDMDVEPFLQQGFSAEDQGVLQPRIEDYPWYRSCVLATAVESVEPTQVERALYVLGQRAVKAPGMSWKDYGSALLLAVE